MPVKPPTCRICGAPHWSTQPHDKDGLKRMMKGSATGPKLPPRAPAPGSPDPKKRPVPRGRA